MTTILTPTADGIAVQSSLAGAKVGRWGPPPYVPDRCYECFDVEDGNIIHRLATGYVEEPEPNGTMRYGACPACWSRRTKRPYLQWIPAGTNCVYSAVMCRGKWHVYGFNWAAGAAWTQYATEGYLYAEYNGPYNTTTIYLTEKAVTEATEFFLVQNEEGEWRSIYADGTPTVMCFYCGEENAFCRCRR
jgi:hypothetical protein